MARRQLEAPPLAPAEPDDSLMNARLLSKAIAASRDGVTISDASLPDMPLVYVNPAFEALAGYAADEILHRNCRFLQGKDTDQAGIEEIRAAIKNKRGCMVTLRNYRKDGTLFHNELSLSPVFSDEGKLTHYIGIQKDVSDRVRDEQNLAWMNKLLSEQAATDQLTGLMNRRAFDGALDREWRRARRVQAALSVFMIDLDHFKNLNDTHGHPAGDEVLRRVANELLAVFSRAGDFVARYGGEEFVVLCAGIERGEAKILGERLLKALRELRMPHGIDPVTASVGLCTMSVTAKQTARQFLEKADQALYQAKDAGRNRMVVCDE